jgi:hypothetical protein
MSDSYPRWGRWGPATVVPFFRGLMARVAASFALLVGGLVWVIVYLAFLADRFPWYQNLAVVLLSFLLVPIVLIAMWVHWGLTLGRRVRRAFWDDWEP